MSHGYDFGRALRPLRQLFSHTTETIPPEATVPKYGTPPESSVLLAAKHRYEKTDGKDWDAATVEAQQDYLDSTRVIISSGPLLTKAKYLAKVGATSWNEALTNDMEVQATAR
jgi:hypothetical protein